MEDFSSDEDNNNANKGEESDGSADSNGSYIIMTKEKVQTALDLKIKEMFAKAFTKPKGEA